MLPNKRGHSALWNAPQHAVVSVKLDKVAGVKRPCGVVQIDQCGNAVLAGHDRAVREGPADVGREPADRREGRRPADVDDRHDQDLIWLNLARFGQCQRDARASAFDAVVSELEIVGKRLGRGVEDDEAVRHGKSERRETGEALSLAPRIDAVRVRDRDAAGGGAHGNPASKRGDGKRVISNRPTRGSEPLSRCIRTGARAVVGCDITDINSRCVIGIFFFIGILF